ncbi:MAG: hypothetical protein QM497_10490 [Sulfurimonas sp.]
MARNKMKKILAVAIMIFSLSLFVNPALDTSLFEINSENVLDVEKEGEQQSDKQEKNTFLTFKSFAFSNLNSNQLIQASQQYQHTYQDNNSLFRPPILLS